MTNSKAGWRLAAATGLVAAAACFPGVDLGLDFDQGELTQANSCSDLQSQLQSRAIGAAEARSYLAITGGNYSTPGFTFSEPGDSTPTNNQERGVDEADFFKYDGAAFAIHGGKLVIADESGVLSDVNLSGNPYEMHVDGDRVFVLARSDRSEIKEHFAAAPDRDNSVPVVSATLYDVSDRTQPKIVRELLFEGEVIGTRRVGDNVYLVTKAMLGGPKEAEEPTGDEHWLATRRRVVENAKLDSWLPSFYDKTQKKVERCACKDTYVSAAATGNDAVTVYSVSMRGDAADRVETTTIFGDGAEIYASTRSLVVALPAEERVGESFQGDSNAGPEQVTWLHRFALNGGEPAYKASGRVKGWILNQFSLSEHNGFLRVATMTGTRGANDAASHVYILDQANKEKELFSAGGDKADFLREVGSRRDIAVGEDLYAARFQGDVGYLVTFRETDPLWTLDLSNPEQPKLLGELMVPGYSTYLHPIEGGHIIAVGRGGRGEEGVKLSLFDVRDLSNPKVVEEEVFGARNASSSAALTDHRAFNYSPEHKRLAIPYREGNLDGLNVFKVSPGDGFRFQGHVLHKDMSTTGRASILRSLTVGDKLWALSSAGITVSDVNTVETLVAIDLVDGPLPE